MHAQPYQPQLWLKAIEGLKKQIVWVSGHIRPDGDCLGSQVAFVRALRTQDIEAYVLIAETLPAHLIHFIGDTPCVSVETADWNTPAKLVCLDTADMKRLPASILNWLGNRKPYLFIDHHRSARPYAEFNIIDSQAAATAEVLMDLFLMHGLDVDAITAQALYLGILTDTGQFRYSSTRPQTLKIAATLIEKGACPAKLSAQLYEQETLARMSLLARFLGSLTLHLDNQLCMGQLLLADYAATQTTPADSEGFVDYTRAIQGVKIGAVLEEQQNQTKGSLRCQDSDLRLDLLAEKMNGGGHACAAGFKVNEPIAVFYPRFMELVHTHLKERAQTKHE